MAEYKMKLVKFKDGTFGLMKKSLFSRPEFLGVKNHEWWSMPCMVPKYCKFKTQEEAETVMEYMDLSYKVIKSE
jgi:hypothetical protein